MESIKESLVEEVEDLLEQFRNSKDQKEKTEISKQIGNLTNQILEIEKEEHDYEEKCERLKMEQNRYDDELMDHRDELALKQRSLDEQKKSRITDIVMRSVFWVGEGLITLGVGKLVIGLEKDITLTSCLRNSWIARFMPKKK